MPLVPLIHALLLDADRIASIFHEPMVEQSRARGSVSSKSVDIEQTLSYGVHGPNELIVLVRNGRA